MLHRWSLLVSFVPSLCFGACVWMGEQAKCTCILWVYMLKAHVVIGWAGSQIGRRSEAKVYLTRRRLSMVDLLHDVHVVL